MLKTTLLFLLMLSSSSVAFAGLLKIDYVGEVNNRSLSGTYNPDVFDLSIGDIISGTFLVDLTKLPNDLYESNPARVYYDNGSYLTNSPVEFVSEAQRDTYSGDRSSPDYLNGDRIAVANDVNGQDMFGVADYERYYKVGERSYVSYIRLSAWDTSIDFINTVDLSSLSFSLNEAQLSTFSYSENTIYFNSAFVLPNGEYDYSTQDYQKADFKLTSLSVSAVDVSAPSSLALAFLFVPFLFSRRLKVQMKKSTSWCFFR